jgi:hypothetical protein
MDGFRTENGVPQTPQATEIAAWRAAGSPVLSEFCALQEGQENKN